MFKLYLSSTIIVFDFENVQTPFIFIILQFKSYLRVSFFEFFCTAIKSMTLALVGH